MSRPFQIIDVFGEADFSGNPLAIIADADDLDTEAMQAIARWLNLSETTFLCRPTDPRADYRVRIFTLTRELPFAGHPTLGSCHAWLANGGRPQSDRYILQQCAAGVIAVRREERLAFAAPPLIRSGPLDEATLEDVVQVLRIDRSAIRAAQWVDNGPGWAAVLLESAEAVLALEPARAYSRAVNIGVVGAHPSGAPAAFEIRALLSGQHDAIIEDPVTGSLNASVAQWLFASQRVTRGYVAAQGTRLGRTGRVYVDCDAAGQVWVGGRTRQLFSGRTC